MLHYHKEFPNVLTSMDLSTTNLNVILSIKKKKKILLIAAEVFI